MIKLYSIKKNKKNYLSTGAMKNEVKLIIMK